MAFGGSLQDFGMPEILQLIGSEGKTGVLSLKRKGEKISVHFEKGKVVWLETSTTKLEDMILEILKKRDRISEKEYSELYSRWSKKVQKLSSAILDLKQFSIEDIQNISSFCLLEFFYPLFCWKIGDYTFVQERGPTYDKKLISPLDTQSLVMEGVRQFDELKRIDAIVPSCDTVFKKIPEKESLIFLDPKAGESDIDDMFEGLDFSELTKDVSVDNSADEKVEDYPDNAVFLEDKQMAVFSLINGDYTLKGISLLGEISTFDVRKSVAKLLNAGVIEESVRKTKKKKTNIRNSLYSLMFLVFLTMSLFYLSVFLGSKVALFLVPSTSFKEEVNKLQNSMNVHKKKKIAFCVEVYRLQEGSFPKSLSLLVKSDLLNNEDLFDPWNKKYLYEQAGRKYFIKNRSK